MKTSQKLSTVSVPVREAPQSPASVAPTSPPARDMTVAATTEETRMQRPVGSPAPLSVQFLIVFLATLFASWRLLPTQKAVCLVLAFITATHHALPHSLCQRITRRAAPRHRQSLQSLALFCTTFLLVTLHHLTQHYLA